MKKYKWLILLNFVAILLFICYSIWNNEKIYQLEENYLLELAPVDPRSLLQGDYMELNYKIAQHRISDNLRDGFIIAKIKDRNLLVFQRAQKDMTPIVDGEIALAFQRNNRSRIQLGIESYFFQEGNGEQFQQAIYGSIKVDKNGKCMLVNLLDKDFSIL